MQECVLLDDSNFLRSLRDDESHAMFVDMRPEGPESVEAIDKFYMWITPIIAQFAATGLPHYSSFKAQAFWSLFLACRRLSCTWLRPMVCGQRKQP